MRSPILLLAICGPLLLATACGSNTASTTAPPPAATTGSVSLLVTDAPVDSWSQIGVIVRKATLVPVGATVAGGAVLYDGATAGQTLNLVDLDGVSELLNSAQIPPGTYDRLVVEVDGSPSSITLVPAGSTTAIPASQIAVRGVDPTTGNAAVSVLLSTPVTVVAGQATSVQADFNLAHPQFIVAHGLGGNTVYNVEFQIRQMLENGVRTLVQAGIRPVRGTVASVAADAKSLQLKTVYGYTRGLLLDATTPAVFYDLDTLPVTAVPSLTVPAALTAPKALLATARINGDGTLTAVRIAYSADASKLITWTPAGHVASVDTANARFTIQRATGIPAVFGVDAATQFYYQAGATAIGTGPAFLANLTKGFKLQVTAVNPNTTPMVAATVTIERGTYEGEVTAASATGFTVSKVFTTTPETHTLGFGTGFSWWNALHPETASTDVNAFIAQAMPASGPRSQAVSSLDWTNGAWVSRDAVFIPAALSSTLQSVATPYASGQMVVSYTPQGAAAPVLLTVNLGSLTNGGTQTLTVVTEYKKVGSVVTVTPILLEAQWASRLAAGAKVAVFGLPKGDGTLNAYWVNLFD